MILILMISKQCATLVIMNTDMKLDNLCGIRIPKQQYDIVGFTGKDLGGYNLYACEQKTC